MHIMQIPSTEIVSHPLSFGDPNGRLFWWKGQLYRALDSERVPLYRRLFANGTVPALVEKGLLVDTEMTSLTLDGSPMIIRHREIPFVSYPFEWCTTMLRDAALAVIDIETELAEHGLTLQDAHPWNVLFDGPKPLNVDFGSIVPASVDALWPAHEEYRRFFVHSLHLMVRGHGRIARWLLHDHEQGVLHSDFIALTRGPLRLRVGRLAVRVSSLARRYIPTPLRPLLSKAAMLLKSSRVAPVLPRSRRNFLKRIKQEVERIAIPPLQTEWSNYYEGALLPFSHSDDWTAKHSSVDQVLSDLRPASLLDVGSNRGWYAQLAALRGSQVVAFDVDEACVTQLYLDSKEQKLSILPLIMDFKNPSPGYGVCNQWLAPATERLRCDMVLGLALVHHLVFKQHLNFEQIVDGLAIFSKRWLLVEFIPPDDIYVREWWSARYSWYTLANFIAALKRRFGDVQQLPSHPAPRVLLLCERS